MTKAMTWAQWFDDRVSYRAGDLRGIVIALVLAGSHPRGVKLNVFTVRAR